MTSTTPLEETAIAEALLSAHRNGKRLQGEPLVPVDQAAAYRVQRHFVALCGGRGGWKVGAASPLALPLRAPLPSAWLQQGDGRLEAAACAGGLEVELAFTIGQHLPAGATHSRDQVVAALASLHVSIEVLASRQPDTPDLPADAKLADLINHGTLIVGAGSSDWQGLDLLTPPFSVSISGNPVLDHGANPAGDPIRLVHWLANSLDPADGGLEPGDIVTTGSWIGLYSSPGAGHRIEARIGNLQASLQID